MKKLWIALALSLAFAACAGAAETDSSGAGSKKLLIVASLFPQYDFARQIAGDRATVVMLLPPGAEAHTFDPRPGDIRTLNKADLFIYTGEAMEPWAKRMLDGLDNKNLAVVDASKGIALHRVEDEDGHDHDHDDHDHDHDHEGHGEYDPHIWLDLGNAEKMVDTIADALCARDSANAEIYRKRTLDYKIVLGSWNSGFAFGAKTAKSEGHGTLVFGGPFAYRYFLERYGWNYITAYDSCSAEGEPGVRRVADVIRYMKDNDIRFLFYDPLESSKVARSIAEAAGAELLAFSTAHTVTKDEFEAGITFVDLLRRNMKNVEKAVGYPDGMPKPIMF